MLEEIKLYLRLDSEDDNNWIEKTLIPAINTYFKNAGINIDAVKNEELYKLAVEMMACHWYENRGIIGDTKGIDFGLKTIMLQLQFCYEEGNI
ncbi:head-tail connector protein [Clostridioides difficile]|uniref:head-tail connector protein n=1 Tax=Clostridioides difficile TaxID=1496 RepID=UPI0021CD1E25|nr:head-tail connector protein [Clostridioides difficile]MCU5977961.1 phage gp6-like head-tail connector protein [Clostridioides difficile]MCU6153093.1 phage gp6-like head-tail connector protein [Clostridioides difficile]MDI3042746.1 head-tail connector protein [Clostridioides difficile]